MIIQKQNTTTITTQRKLIICKLFNEFILYSEEMPSWDSYVTNILDLKIYLHSILKHHCGGYIGKASASLTIQLNWPLMKISHRSLVVIMGIRVLYYYCGCWSFVFRITRSEYAYGYQLFQQAVIFTNTIPRRHCTGILHTFSSWT